jgi:hypothetical protein
MWSACVAAGVGDTAMQKGVLAVGEVMEPGGCPDGSGDARPADTELPKREPGPGAGRTDHPLPNLFAQDAARIARLLADERAGLEAQADRSTPD